VGSSAKSSGFRREYMRGKRRRAPA